MPILLCGIACAFLIYKDYGLQVDSLSSRSIGGKAAVYAYAKVGYFLLSEEKLQAVIEKQAINYSKKDSIKLEDKYLQDPMRYYGVFYEIFLLIGERIAGTDNLKESFFIRHIVTHLTFIAALIFLFFSLRRHSGSAGFALFSCLLLYLSPRIFADSFYNSKDIPFMCFYTAAGISLLRFVNHFDNKNAVLHGIFSGLTVSLRIPGIIVPAFTFFLIFVLYVGKIRRVRLKPILLYLSIFLLTVYVSFPVLWFHPIDSFAAAFNEMKAYPFPGDILFLSEIYKSNELPPTYLPVWFGSTVPLVVLSGLLLFPFALCYELRKEKRTKKLLALSVLIGLGIGPVAAVILLKSNLYDAWRQMFFVYPPLAVLAVYGWHGVFEKNFKNIKHRRTVSVAACVGIILHLLWVNYNLHPYQNVYFNSIAAQPIEKNYELDYWGLSYREGFEYVLENEAAGEISVYTDRFAGLMNRHGLTDAQKKRLRLTDNPAEAKYFVYSFRAVADEDDYLRKKGIDPNQEVYRVERNGLVLLRVFKL